MSQLSLSHSIFTGIQICCTAREVSQLSLSHSIFTGIQICCTAPRASPALSQGGPVHCGNAQCTGEGNKTCSILHVPCTEEIYSVVMFTLMVESGKKRGHGVIPVSESMVMDSLATSTTFMFKLGYEKC